MIDLLGIGFLFLVRGFPTVFFVSEFCRFIVVAGIDILE